MERGPLALFGAIVAVGLGPALWLGAQFGSVDLTPKAPAAVTVVQNPEVEPGGVGAADADPVVELDTPTPKLTPTARPHSRVKVTVHEEPQQTAPETTPEKTSPVPTTPTTVKSTTPTAVPSEPSTEETIPPTPDGEHTPV
jgi:hypothetical protein